MGEPKSKSIMVNIEPTIYGIVQEYIAKSGQSAASYGRSLIIKDLRERGILPDKVLADLVLSQC